MTPPASLIAASTPRAAPQARIARRRWTGIHVPVSVHSLLVGVAIAAGWLLKDQNFIRAQSGMGYWLGIVGTGMMISLLLYPARKRLRALRQLGAVRHWFKAHMVLGIAGPLLILFHCNFNLGSLNSRIALFSMLVVAASGVIGRYIYAKLHHGLYGQRASLQSISSSIDDMREAGSSVAKLVPDLASALSHLESRYLAHQGGVLLSFWWAAVVGTETWLAERRLKPQLRDQIAELASTSKTLHDNQARLAKNASQYLSRRLTLVRKFAQLRAFERLFSLWHIVHYPLFIVLIVAVTLHVVAVHMY